MEIDLNKTFYIEAEKRGDVVICKISGRLDTYSTPAAEVQMAKIIAGSSNKVVVDLKNVNYMSSAGLRMILLLSRKATRSGGKLIISSPPNNVLSVLTVTDRTLNIAENIDDAVKIFSKK